MLLWIVLLLCLFVILFPATGFPKTMASRYEREVHPYSGLDPETWQEFKVNIRAYEREQDVAVAARQLYAAMENIRNLGLSIQRADDHEHQEKLEDIASRLGVEGEYDLYTNAKRKGVYFFPRYLNETIDEQAGNAAKDTRRGGTIGDTGVHYPAPRQRGDTGPPPTEDAFWADRQGAREIQPTGGV
jgi:hypothetical protein